MIGFVTWPPLLCQSCYKGGQVTKPFILVKTCYKTIAFQSSSLKHFSVIGDFLASADTKAFGRTWVELLDCISEQKSAYIVNMLGYLQ